PRLPTRRSCTWWPGSPRSPTPGSDPTAGPSTGSCARSPTPSTRTRAIPTGGTGASRADVRAALRNLKRVKSTSTRRDSFWSRPRRLVLDLGASSLVDLFGIQQHGRCDGGSSACRDRQCQRGGRCIVWKVGNDVHVRRSEGKKEGLDLAADALRGRLCRGPSGGAPLCEDAFDTVDRIVHLKQILGHRASLRFVSLSIAPPRGPCVP